MDWPLLAPLEVEDRRAVLSSCRRRRFRRGEVLVREGDPADSLHLVESGRLMVSVTTREGDRTALNVLGPGQYFGELSLLDGRAPRRSADVLALEAAETLVLSAASFHSLRRRSSTTADLLLILLARRVEELSARVVEAMFDSLDTRVYRRLDELAALYSDDDTGPVHVPLTQELLADLAGGTRPSVNQVLQRLANQGIVELARGRITVVDRALLSRKAA